MTIRVLLADDHLLFAQALAHLLSDRYEVVDIVGNGKALQVSALKHKPDIVVTDVTMPLMNGLEGIRSLLKSSYAPKVVFLTMHADAELARECFTSGGAAFVSKESGFDEIIRAMEAVLANHQYLSPAIAAGLMDGLRETDVPGSASAHLTSRQREILQLFAEGKTMKEIATATNLSTRTVEWHKYKMMRILGARHSAELIQHALRLRLVI